MKNKKLLSCLIIGCGNIAGGFDAKNNSDQLPLTHAGAYRQHGGFELLACIDPDPTTRVEFMRRWNIVEGYASMDQLECQVGRFDIVSICSPTAAHHLDVQAVLALKPLVLFCEKPLAANLSDAEAIVSACKNARVPLIVNYNRRWDKMAILVKGEIESGLWGQVRSVVGIYTRGISNNGSHMVDLLHFLFGPLRITGVGTLVDDGFGDDPSIPVSLLSDSGIPIVLACGHAQDYSLFELQIVTEIGVISMEDGGLAWRIRRAVPSPVFRNYRVLDSESERVAGTLQGTMLAAVSEIYQIANSGGALTSTGDSALAAIQICEKAKELATQKAAPNL